MGRPAKSIELHELHGTTPHKPTSAAFSNVAAGRPKTPGDLKGSQRSQFKKIVKFLENRRTVTEADADLIRLLCIVKDRHSRNRALLDVEGDIRIYFRLDSNGESVPQEKENLRLKICTDAERQMVSILEKLGMTVTSKDKSKPTTNAAEENAPGSVGWILAGGK